MVEQAPRSEWIEGRQAMLKLASLGWGAKRISRELGCSRNPLFSRCGLRLQAHARCGRMTWLQAQRVWSFRMRWSASTRGPERRGRGSAVAPRPPLDRPTQLGRAPFNQRASPSPPPLRPARCRSAGRRRAATSSGAGGPSCRGPCATCRHRAALPRSCCSTHRSSG